ncbi:S-layer protein [Gracilibacillus dipsosauri]|uniref:galactosylceramidase n=1 Tax=Gracilibacillus dipsosauri TaxID=178340 RepID=A0A317L2F0_9BACI|nr:S-layer protein [Gracilibacillus dipsosauri]PWU69414.1 S-layer protein [Gracilibacillus dipsosauri]
MGRRNKKRIWVFASIMIIIIAVTVFEKDDVKADQDVQTITIDGEKVNDYHRFKGFGVVTANNTSRLLLDYKEEHPDKYWEIMNHLFNPDTGAGLAHVKIELGADVNSSSGTEPATKRKENEPANVRRGAGFQFAADAKSINPNITTEILRWGEPRWTWNGAKDGNFENRYQWYKQTIDAVYEEYGFKLDYIGISQNERAINGNGRVEVEWLKYFTSKIKQEPNYESDYKHLKLVAADGYRDTSSISQVLLDEPDLIDEIDVISSHYGLTGSGELNQLQEQLIAEGKQPKELWVSEGIAPMINARYRDNMEPQYHGLGGRAGIIDVTSRIISVYSWTGAGNYPLNAVSFDFQPAVAAFYQGAQYNPKHLISAFDPWSGFYEVDGGITGVRHVMNFVEQDDPSTKENERWMYVEDATYSDGEFFDGGVDVDTSTHNYLTLKDPKTDDYTTVFANNTNLTRKYKIQTKNLSNKQNAPVYVWETRGPDKDESYDENWLQNIDVITPKEGTYEVEVKPYSIVTISTLDKESEVSDFTYQSNPVDLTEDTIMPLPYKDNFEYDDYSIDEKGRDYVERRGGTPRYTTDQIGAFEVVTKETKLNRDIPNAEPHGNMLMQKITPDMIGAEWSVWGGEDGSAADVNPHTVLGDFRWVNYKASFDFLLDTDTQQVEGRENYVLIGLRQVKSAWSDSSAPYNARIYADGRYELWKLGNIEKSGTLKGFNNKEWHHLAFEAKENNFTLYLDGKEIDSFIDEDATVMAGRVAIGSGYYQTLFDNLHIDKLKRYTYTSEKYDNAQGKKMNSEEEALSQKDKWNPISYIGDWEFLQSGYGHFNRTLMRAGTEIPVWNGVTITHQDIAKQQGDLNKVYYQGDWSSNSNNAWGSDGEAFEIKFKGHGIRLYGEANPNNGKADIYLDGKLVAEGNYLNNSSMEKMVWSAENLEEREHTLRVVAKDGWTSFTKAEVETNDPISDGSDKISNSSMIFHFNGSGFNLFGATSDSIVDVYIDGVLVDDDYRIQAKGDRQTSYSIRGLKDQEHSAKVYIKAGEFTFDGMDIITGKNKIEVDKAELQELYDTHKDKNRKKYTKQSWKIFHKALLQAKRVLKNPQSTILDVAEARSSLDDAIAELKKK